MKMLLIALVVGFTTSALGQTLRLDSCPDIAVIDSYDLNQFKGLWYINRRSQPIVYEQNQKCATLTFSDFGIDKMRVVYPSISTLTGQKSVSVGIGSIDTEHCKNHTNCGKVIAEFPVGTGFYRPYWILNTDYTSYTVVWSCSTSTFGPLQYLWILTREVNPSASTLKLAFETILKHGLGNIPLNSIDHTQCPKLIG